MMQVADTGETMSGDSDAAYHDDDDWQAALLLLDQANCEGMSSDAIPLLPQPQEQQPEQPQRHTSWTPSTYSSSGWSMQGGPSSTMPHVVYVPVPVPVPMSALQYHAIRRSLPPYCPVPHHHDSMQQPMPRLAPPYSMQQVMSPPLPPAPQYFAFQESLVPTPMELWVSDSLHTPQLIQQQVIAQPPPQEHKVGAENRPEPQPRSAGRRIRKPPPLCKYPDCTRVDKGRGYCKQHGGGKRCGAEGCTIASRGATGLCIKHGGGPRCRARRCTKSARTVGGYCKAHGGVRKCAETECSRTAQGRGALCRDHALQFFSGTRNGVPVCPIAN